MVAIHLSVIRCFLNLCSVFSSWSVFIGTSPSFDRVVSWLVRVYVLTVTLGCSVCWFTDFFSLKACVLLCSIALHTKEDISIVNASSFQLWRKCRFLQGAVLNLHATLRHVTFIYIQASPDVKSLFKNWYLPNKGVNKLTVRATL